jgi:hypothetical protein
MTEKVKKGIWLRTKINKDLRESKNKRSGMSQQMNGPEVKGLGQQVT